MSKIPHASMNYTHKQHELIYIVVILAQIYN